MGEGDDGRMIHYDVDPFAAPVDQRDPARRFRGRLASPVTIWTATGDDGEPNGITIGSILVAEGQPAMVVGLIDPLSPFWTTIAAARRFVVHVVDRSHRRMADQFAGRYPGPDARFEDVDLRASAWGPVITDLPTRAYCTLSESQESGDSMVVTAAIDAIELDDLDAPLVYFRGAYHDLTPRRPQ